MGVGKRQELAIGEQEVMADCRCKTLRENLYRLAVKRVGYLEMHYYLVSGNSAGLRLGRLRHPRQRRSCGSTLPLLTPCNKDASCRMKGLKWPGRGSQLEGSLVFHVFAELSSVGMNGPYSYRTSYHLETDDRPR